MSKVYRWLVHRAYKKHYIESYTYKQNGRLFTLGWGFDPSGQRIYFLGDKIL